jgi:phosphate:Na+ symporter
MVIIYSIYYTVGIPIFSKVCNRGNIANIHLGFNLIISVVLLPFSNQMANFTGKLIKDNDEVYGDEELRRLDDMLLKTPGIALTQCKEVMRVMGEKIFENYTLAIGLIFEYDKTAFNRLNDNENFIDKCETVLSDYIVRINRNRLTIDNRDMITAILNSIGDYERIGDYSMNIAYTAQECFENKVVFSKKGLQELSGISEAAGHMLSMVFEAFDSENMNKAYRVQPLAKIVDEMKNLLE